MVGPGGPGRRTPGRGPRPHRRGRGPDHRDGRAGHRARRRGRARPRRPRGAGPAGRRPRDGRPRGGRPRGGRPRGGRRARPRRLRGVPRLCDAASPARLTPRARGPPRGRGPAPRRRRPVGRPAHRGRTTATRRRRARAAHRSRRVSPVTATSQEVSVGAEPVALGIDVGGTKLVAATVAADGRVLDRRRRTTPARDDDLLVDTLTELVGELGQGLPVGIGIAGMVNPAGDVVYGPNIAVRDLPLARRLEERSGTLPAVVNDASAAALGEQRAGAARDHRDVVLLTLGTGVGGGLVLDGRLHIGANGFGAETGHVIIEERGRPCPCGNRGCIEAYASGTAIGLLARERLVDPEASSTLREVTELTGREVSDAALAGDRLAQDVLTEVGGWLGVAAASLVNLLDPEVILIGGGAGAATAPWVLPAAERSLAARLFGRGHREPPPFALTELGDDAGMVGAALLAAERAGVTTGDAEPSS
ncbi:ROK family protein [Nitriliruptoraceae bacterium ZYF776]|nr:ROK family protein [Profundirhabdus halotolerans]